MVLLPVCSLLRIQLRGFSGQSRQIPTTSTDFWVSWSVSRWLVALSANELRNINRSGRVHFWLSTLRVFGRFPPSLVVKSVARSFWSSSGKYGKWRKLSFRLIQYTKAYTSQMAPTPRNPRFILSKVSLSSLPISRVKKVYLMSIISPVNFESDWRGVLLTWFNTSKRAGRYFGSPPNNNILAIIPNTTNIRLHQQY